MAVFALLDAHMVEGVGQRQFLQRDSDLEAVGRAVRVEMQGWDGHGHGKESGYFLGYRLDPILYCMSNLVKRSFLAQEERFPNVTEGKLPACSRNRLRALITTAPPPYPDDAQMRAFGVCWLRFPRPDRRGL